MAAWLVVVPMGTPRWADKAGEDRSTVPMEVGEDVPVTANYAQDPLAQNSPVMAVDPTEERFVVLAHRIDHRSESLSDRGQFGCSLQLSGDGGASWVPAEAVPQLPEGADTCYAPQVAFGPDGTLYYLFVGLQGAGNVPMGVFLTTSTDRGRSFSEPRQIIGANAFGTRMAVGDEGRLHVVWLQANSRPPLGGMPRGDNPIMAAHSDDGGTTWSEPVRVSDPARQRVVAPALAIGPKGAVHVAYYDLRGDVRDYRGLEGPVWDGTWSLVVATADDGQGVTRRAEVTDGVVPAERVMLIFTMPPPALAAGPDGRVYVGWDGARNGDRDVFVARSRDRARSWQAPARVNDDPVGNGRAQYLPQLAVADTGRLDAVFYDRRRDPDNTRTDVFLASSIDGGRTFRENVRVNSRAFSSQIGARYAVPSAEGLVEFGSGLALHSTAQGAVAAWADTRNADGPRHQDIFASKITAASPNAAATDSPAQAAWLAGGLLLLGAAAAVGGWRVARSRQQAGH